MLNGTEHEKHVRWVVMGDDDTVFFAENLLRVLRKYDHKQFYYIGAPSESHLQNLHQFSYGMAYGGGGFAISYPLAKALEKIQDRCIERYSDLYGSDDRIHACMAEIGVPLTREAGFHQVSPFFFFFPILGFYVLKNKKNKFEVLVLPSKIRRKLYYENVRKLKIRDLIHFPLFYLLAKQELRITGIQLCQN